MSTLITLTCAGILLLFILFVGKPLLRSRPAGVRASTDRRWLQLSVERDAAYAAIRELDFDRDVGKVSGEDYGDLHAALEATAVVILQELDELAPADVAAVEARVKRDVTALKSAGSATGEADATVCPSCGERRLADHRFCPQCGGRLEVAE